MNTTISKLATIAIAFALGFGINQRDLKKSRDLIETGEKVSMLF